jgi:hypothetical protein
VIGRVAALGLLLLAGCHDVRACDPGTLFIELTADASVAGATQLSIDAVFGSETLHADRPYAGQEAASLALDFPKATGYPAGQSLTLTVTAMKGATAVASGTTTVTLAVGCTRLSVALAGGGGVTLVGASSAPAAHADSVTLAPPAETQAGDLLVLCVYANSSTAAATLPSGWTALEELTSTRGFHVWWLTAIAGASQQASVVTTFDQALTTSAAIVGYRGSGGSPTVETPASPETLTGTVSGNQITFVEPAITTTHAADRLAAFFVYDSGDGGSWPAIPAGTTKLIDTGSIGLFERAAPAAGDTGSLTASASFAANDEIYGTALVAAVTAP